MEDRVVTANGVEAVMSFDHAMRHNRLTIDSGISNFRHKVQLYSSENGHTWDLLEEGRLHLRLHRRRASRVAAYDRLSDFNPAVHQGRDRGREGSRDHGRRVRSPARRASGDLAADCEIRRSASRRRRQAPHHCLCSRLRFARCSARPADSLDHRSCFPPQRQRRVERQRQPTGLPTPSRPSTERKESSP